MFYSLSIGGIVGCAFFVVLIHTSWCPLLGSALYLCWVESIYHSPTFSSLFNGLMVFLFLFISSRLLYHPYGKPVTVWSSMFMRDDEWITILNCNIFSTVFESFKVIFTINTKHPPATTKISDNQMMVHQHINCVMCYVISLPTKLQLTQVITNVISNYPQLRNIPIVGDDMTQSSFETDYTIYNNVDSHINEYRLNKRQIEDLDEIMSNKIPMDLHNPWWDIWLITPDVQNDIRALDPQHAMLCVVVFRFHQSIIDLPTIKQFLYDISSEFQKLNGFMDDMDSEEEKRMEDRSTQNIFGQPQRYPSQFNLSPTNSLSLCDTDASSDEMVNEMDAANRGSSYSAYGTPNAIQHNIMWLQHQLQSVSDMIRSLFMVLRMLFSNGNAFDSNNGYTPIQVITERFQDTALTKIQREAKASLEHVGRACIAGALLRYFEDQDTEYHSDRGLNLERSRILESYDLSQNTTELIAEYSREIPLFKESLGLTSIELSIDDGGDYQTARSRLMSIAHRYDVGIYYRIAFWINQCFKFFCVFLPDLMSKKMISIFLQNHTMELCYFEYADNFMLGAEPVEDLRVFKTNLNIPCLCISSYNEHISLDLAFTSVAIKNPAGLIQGFLAELEQLEAMFR